MPFCVCLLACPCQVITEISMQFPSPPSRFQTISTSLVSSTIWRRERDSRVTITRACRRTPACTTSSRRRRSTSLCSLRRSSSITRWPSSGAPSTSRSWPATRLARYRTSIQRPLPSPKRTCRRSSSSRPTITIRI